MKKLRKIDKYQKEGLFTDHTALRSSFFLFTICPALFSIVLVPISANWSYKRRLIELKAHCMDIYHVLWDLTKHRKTYRVESYNIVSTQDNQSSVCRLIFSCSAYCVPLWCPRLTLINFSQKTVKYMPKAIH